MNRNLRHNRIRKKIIGSKQRPRVSVYRSLNGLWVQLIDDENGATLISASHKNIKKSKDKTDQAQQLGLLIAQLAAQKKITQVVFDRGGYQYHGRIKTLAESLRQAGLKF